MWVLFPIFCSNDLSPKCDLFMIFTSLLNIYICFWDICSEAIYTAENMPRSFNLDFFTAHLLYYTSPSSPTFQPHICRIHPWPCWCCTRLYMCVHEPRMWGAQRDTGPLWFIDTNDTVSIRHTLRISGVHAVNTLVDTHTHMHCCTGLRVCGRCMWKCSLIVSGLGPAAGLCCKFTNWCVDSSFVWVFISTRFIENSKYTTFIDPDAKKPCRCF